ncbi:hypothetical protein RirG_168600 [Rhizophagus irregularis DAOM 197198w]|uniref:Uncharacterized protein n=1 Tax=Rhizophagus irregularis (strain DAOM 197198w) TaxID=1432141 RepID=A0A015IWT5_RHIIW|nr:hypothetical protein RirG_168600 [Rhizophagus irregularis DAOM 197198w]
MKVRKQKNVKCESESSPKKTTKKASKKQKTAKGSSTGITRQDSGFTRVIKDLSIRFDSSFRNAERKSESLPKKTIQKAQETVEQSSTVPDRCITRQVSDPTRTRDYSIHSSFSFSSRSSYDLKDLPHYASNFTEDDIRILNATFIPASNENEVIPAVETTNFLRTYIMQNITCVTLERCDFDVGNINSDGHVKTFFYKLHQVVMNAGLDVGMKESKTDSLVTHLLYRAIDFDNWPLAVKVKEKYKIKVSDKKIMAIAEFVIEKQGVAMTIIVEHLENVDVTTDFGEAQILAKILAVANVNTKEKVTNQTLFTVRVISTYVTFYKATISKAYLKEIRKGLPKRRSIEIQRWPGQNGLRTGFDFASPKGRQAVLTALARI